MLFFGKNTNKTVKKKKKTTKSPAKNSTKVKKNPKTLAIKKYTNDSQKPNKDYNSIDVEWLEKKLQNTNKKRVQTLVSDHQEATVKYIKSLLKSDKQ